ncbi:MAG: translation initiation factor IF-3 [Planctomycetes bacterium]|nr:translation initiation factor IF-3 [Planctomycetota bacterium]
MGKQALKINGGIRAENVRLIDEENNKIGIVTRQEAISKARQAGLDLVEVAPTSDPPVCKIMDYGKWQYEQKRKMRQSHKKSQQHVNTLKEVRLRPETDTHDMEIKLKHAREFLGKGHRVQFTMLFRGRQMLHRDRGHEVFAQIIESLEDMAKVEQRGRMANRRMTMLLSPIK